MTEAIPLSRRCGDCYEFGHEDCGCGECGNPRCGVTVGAQVQFRENDEHDRVLGVVSRVWDNGRYATIVSDGRTFVRDLRNVTVTR